MSNSNAVTSNLFKHDFSFEFEHNWLLNRTNLYLVFFNLETTNVFPICVELQRNFISNSKFRTRWTRTRFFFALEHLEHNFVLNLNKTLFRTRTHLEYDFNMNWKTILFRTRTKFYVNFVERNLISNSDTSNDYLQPTTRTHVSCQTRTTHRIRNEKVSFLNA
jgi:hypothetical protein